MVFRVKIWLAFTTLLLMFSRLNHVAYGKPKVPCYFIFGDSLVDNGNNNDLDSYAKANYLPYGIDFPDGPTGRFTNGRNLADFLAQFLGFKNPIPPFATTKTVKESYKGVNYASGAAGIRDETGSVLGDRICLDKQLQNYNETLSKIADYRNNLRLSAGHHSKCLYTVGMGSNDYLNNYFIPGFYQTSDLYTPKQYASVLIEQYSKKLRTLYDMGARKIAVFGLGEIGCTPGLKEAFATSSCVDPVDSAVDMFNDLLTPLIDQLNSDLPDAKFIYINMTSISIGDPADLGIIDDNESCCEVSTEKPKGQCEPNVGPCRDRTAHMYYDNYHPSEISNLVIAKRAFTALKPTDVYPMDISTLVNS